MLRLQMSKCGKWNNYDTKDIIDVQKEKII